MKKKIKKKLFDKMKSKSIMSKGRGDLRNSLDSTLTISRKEAKKMVLKIYNTKTRQKEPFETIEKGRVKMYVCGVTVYDSTHIGHAMCYLIFDVIKRYLEFKGYEVYHIQNFTDIDDKIIERAAQLGVSPEEIADRYSREFFEVMNTLNVKPANIYPRATAEIPMIIKLINGLATRGFTYVVNGNVFFKVADFPRYGQLSKRSLSELRASREVKASELKHDPADFVLWKTAKPGELSWSSPWGPGRPGWHIECSAMCYHYLGEQIDIHGGGNDLIFPHHENEIAQSEAFTGKTPFVRYWLHNGMLQLADEKMSKSVGNILPVKDFLKQYEGDVLRLFVLSSHYRSPVTYTRESIEAASNGLQRIHNALKPGNSDVTDSMVPVEATQARRKFIAAMDDDFNTAKAAAVLFDLAGAINRTRSKGADAKGLKATQSILKELGSVLGLSLDTAQATSTVENEALIKLLIQIRSDLRVTKQWDLADKIRLVLAENGIILEDTSAGTVWQMRKID